MFPGFIIDQIRQREEEEKTKDWLPQLELPVPAREGAPASEPPDEESDRGVVIIDLVTD
jgi:hypothetical protein